MKIYHYHPTTKEFLGSGQADESPREPGVFLFPKFSTGVAPPSAPPAGQVWTWSGEDWDLAEDHRGEVGYLDGIEVTISDLGELPEGWSTEPPEFVPEVDPVQQQLDALDAKFEELLPSPEIQGAFATIWAAVRNALQANKPALALAAVQAAQVPPELEAAKAEFIEMLGG